MNREEPRETSTGVQLPGNPCAFSGGRWAAGRLAGATVAFLAVLPYLFPFPGVLVAPFVFDDIKLVRDNETIRDFSRLPETFNIFSHRWDAEEVRANYRPLRFLSYAVDYRATRWIWGDFAPENLPVQVFHFQNLLLHALNALLVLAIGRRLLRSDAAALCLGLLFAVHPLMTEAVTYISGRRDVLSTFFFLAALRVHLARGEPSLPALLGVPILYVLALLTKEMAATLPALLLLVDLALRARWTWRRWLLAAVLWAMAAGFTAYHAANPSLVAGALGGGTERTVLTVPRYVARYLGLVLFPFPQSIDYSFDAIPVSTGLLSPPATVAAWGLFAGLAVAGLVCLRRGRALGAIGLLWFLGTLAPVMQVVPIPERFAERFAYLPSIGILLLWASLLGKLIAKRAAAGWAAAAALCLVLTFATALRNQDWLSTVDLWASAAEAQPRAARAHLGHGDALLRGGQPRDAVQAFTRSLSILGEEPPEAVARGEPERAKGDELLRWGQVLQARTFRAQAHAALGTENSDEYRKAIEDYRWLFGRRDIDGVAIDRSPKHIVLRYNLAICLQEMARTEPARERAAALGGEAAEEFRRVAAAEADQPSLAKASHFFLGKAALAAGKTDEGLREIEEAYRIACEKGTADDRFNLAGELADLLIDTKSLDRADEILVRSIAEKIPSPERVHLIYRRARIADRRGDLSGSAHLLEDALDVDRSYGPALLTLAGIEESRGRLDRAEELYRKLAQVSPGEPRAARGLKAIEFRRKLAADGKDGAAKGAEGGPGEGGISERGMLEGLISRGEAHLSRGELLAAVEPLRRAGLGTPGPKETAEMRAMRVKALRRLSDVARALNKLHEAENYLIVASQRGGEGREALRDLGDLLLRDLKDRERAAEIYQEYVDTFRAGELAAAGAYLNLASIVQDKEPSRALDLFVLARRAGYSEPILDRTLGYLYARLGRWEESMESFQAYLDRDELAPAPASDPAADAGRAVERQKARQFLLEKVLPNLPGAEGVPAPESKR